MDPPLDYFWGTIAFFLSGGEKWDLFMRGPEKYKKGPAADPALTDYGPNAPRG